ncbi:hypothetical protein VTJ04DRAFT_3904 [Mycothermus thermophilus]|uniref:uncharacterized protein n=1 Tax=Humicola insolens TaxID=85995 RepID=UPI0037432422
MGASGLVNTQTFKMSHCRLAFIAGFYTWIHIIRRESPVNSSYKLQRDQGPGQLSMGLVSNSAPPVLQRSGASRDAGLRQPI